MSTARRLKGERALLEEGEARPIEDDLGELDVLQVDWCQLHHLER